MQIKRPRIALRSRSGLRHTPGEPPLAVRRSAKHQHDWPAIDQNLSAGAGLKLLDVPATINGQIAYDQALENGTAGDGWLSARQRPSSTS